MPDPTDRTYAQQISPYCRTGGVLIDEWRAGGPDLRDVALAALRHYDLAPRRITRAADSFNTVFRVSADTGRYALRVGAALRIHTAGTLQAEAAWPARLRAHGLPVPALHATAAGQAGTVVDGGSGPRTCALFEWVVGRSLRTRLTGPTAAALGRLAARLHRDAEGWTPPEPLDVLVADRVLCWRLPVRLTAPGVPHASVFADALHRAQAELDRLWRTPPHRPFLLHGDLTPANVIVARDGTLVPIDFQDLVRGFAVQDLAIGVAALRRMPAGERLVDAFRHGYTAHRPSPDVLPGLFEALLAARALHQLNLTLNIHGTTGRTGYLAAHAARLREWLRAPGGS
jgi:Ser/Thr protein kinase RdoA (MazF antagonist)